MSEPRRNREELRLAQQYLYHRDAENDAKSQKNKARDSLKHQLAEIGEPDEDGHMRWEFPATMTVNGVAYKGMMNQRRRSTYIDEDKALELAASRGVLEDITTYEPVYDFDRLYVLNQEGKISDEELDDIIGVRIDWALVPIKE